MSKSRVWHVAYHGQRPLGIQVVGTPYTAAMKAFGPFGSFIEAGDGETEKQIIVHDRAGHLLGTLFYMASPRVRRELRIAREAAGGKP